MKFDFLQKTQTKKTALLGILTAVMLILGFVESMLPAFTGIPGVKLGLSNSVLLYAIYTMPVGNAFLLMLGKVLLSGLLFSGVSAMLYSLAGGLLSLIGMILIRKCKCFSPIGVSVCGAVLHNCGQLLVAGAVVGYTAAFSYAPMLLISGTVTGVVTGMVAKLVLRALEGKV